MNWLKDLFSQFKSKTVWGILLILITQKTGLNSEAVTGILDNLVELLTAVGAILTLVGVNHKLEKWIEMFKKR